MNPDRCWAETQIALRILRKVCPEVEEWVRDRHAKGKIVYTCKCDGCYAKYNYMSGELILTDAFFQQNHGKRAVTLAHEFRHSRQNFTKPVKAVIACVIKQRPQEHIVENDAHLFEKEVYLAIFD